LKAKCRGGFHQGGDVTLLGGGEFFKWRGSFFAANLAYRAILFYQGGDILSGRCYFVTPAHMAETMKFMASFKALGWDLYVAVIHQMSPRSWALLTNLTESVGKEDPATQLPPLQAAHGSRWEARWGHVPKAQGLKSCGRGSRPCNREGARGGWQI